MRTHPMAAACVAALTVSTLATAQHCGATPPLATLATHDPFLASFFFGSWSPDSVNLYFDLDAQVPITIAAMRGTSYDNGTPGSGLPDQVGATTTVNVYSYPQTRVGHEGSSNGWTQLGSGTMTIVGWPGKSPIVFSPPLAIPAGTWGIAVEILPTVAPNSPSPGPIHPIGPMPNPFPTASDQFLTISNQGIQSSAWVGNATNVFDAGVNLELDYDAPANFAYWTKTGAGCYDRPRSFYEVIQAPAAAPALENTAITLQLANTAAGRHWIANASNAVYVPPTGVPRSAVAPAVWLPFTPAVWNDALDAPITLPFTFTFPGGSTNVVTAGSNGQLLLTAVSDPVAAAPFNGDYDVIAQQDPRLCAFWADLDLQAGSGTQGGLYYETGIVNLVRFARFTWDRVAERSPTNTGGLNSFQVTLWSDDRVDLVYGDLSIAAHDAFVGFFELQGAPRPTGPIAFSTALPLHTGDGALPPRLALDARPVLGTTVSAISTTSPTISAQVGLFVTGFDGAPTPIDLSSFGMPGCSLHLDQAQLLGLSLLTFAPNGQAAVPIVIPSAAPFAGLRLFLQTATLSSGLNAGGMLASNAVCLRLGL